MQEVGKLLLIVFFVILGLLFFWLAAVRIVRRFVKFPTPPFAVKIINSRFRRAMQQPGVVIKSFAIEEDMKVLEIGPGSGTYTFEAAKAVGDSGKMTVLDIQPEVIDIMKHAIIKKDCKNIDTVIGSVFSLPFPDKTFDRVMLVTVIGEIPDPQKAVDEFRRVLKDDGLLCFSELLLDPDYPMPGTLRKLVEKNGFRMDIYKPGILSYSMCFGKAQV